MGKGCRGCDYARAIIVDGDKFGHSCWMAEQLTGQVSPISAMRYYGFVLCTDIEGMDHLATNNEIYLCKREKHG